MTRSSTLSLSLLGSCLVWASQGLIVASKKDIAADLKGLFSPLVPSGRSFFQKVITLASTSVPIASRAQDAQTPAGNVGKPFVPLEALLPAARLKVSVDQVYELSSALASTNDSGVRYDMLRKVDAMLSNPPKLFLSERFRQRASRPTAQITTGVSSANKEQYQRNRSDMSIPDRIAAMLNQADVERQWGMLQYAESKREQDSEMRAAFNYYVSQLQFADSYRLMASKEERKGMIRNDELPSLTAVITSDLDLRDLYRNEFLTAIEDARAEVSYQLRQPPESVDITDVTDLVGQAHTACSKWFSLIPPQDVQDAVEVTWKENQKTAANNQRLAAKERKII